jgi:hypothetical protein
MTNSAFAAWANSPHSAWAEAPVIQHAGISEVSSTYTNVDGIHLDAVLAHYQPTWFDQSQGDFIPAVVVTLSLSNAQSHAALASPVLAIEATVSVPVGSVHDARWGLDGHAEGSPQGEWTVTELSMDAARGVATFVLSWAGLLGSRSTEQPYLWVQVAQQPHNHVVEVQASATHLSGRHSSTVLSAPVLADHP